MHLHARRILILTASLALTACESSNSNTKDDLPTTTNSAEADASAQTNPAEQVEKTEPERSVPDGPVAATADALAVSTAQRVFAGVLFEQASKAAGADGNVFLSPYSIHAALGMTLAGAKGETADELATTLGLDALPEARRHEAMRALRASIVSEVIRKERGVGYTLSEANRVWTGKGLELLASFAETTREQHGAEATSVDFAAEGGEVSREAINSWVSEKTMQKIPELLSKGTIDASTRLVLTNALYFKGAWSTPFDTAGTEEAAFAAPGGEVTVPMMNLGGKRFGYASSDAYETLSIPYTGGADMLVILPRDGKFDAVAKELGGDGLGRVMSLEASARPVNLGLPKFTIRIPLDLNGALAALGIKSAFSPAAADFSGMSEERLYVSKVIHEAFVEVDEEGSEAAAATAVVMGRGTARPSKPIDFIVDRPFFFVIRHTTTNTPLFIGRVMDPSRP